MNQFEFYSKQSAFSSPGTNSSLFDDLPDSIEDLVKITHGLIVHRDATKKFYGFNIPQNRILEADTRYVERILNKIQKLNRVSLATPRKPEDRFLGSCRDFALLLCSILRYKGIPARLRCGFADYFEKDGFTDHWICEYWDSRRKLWIIADSELGEIEKKTYKIKFDNLNVPRNKFIVAGKAWKLCRSGDEPPDSFGVHSIGIKGWWFVRSNVLRDLASLNKIELLPWDYTDFFNKHIKDLSDLSRDELELIDNIAEITANELMDFNKTTSIYKDNRQLQVSNAITSYGLGKPLKYKLVLG